MQCQTVKKDKECFFWAKSGCTQSEGQCAAIIEKCDGCSRVEEWPTGKYCTTYGMPVEQWKIGLCNMATHIKLETEETQKMINPLKASKRGTGGGRR